MAGSRKNREHSTGNQLSASNVGLWSAYAKPAPSIHTWARTVLFSQLAACIHDIRSLVHRVLAEKEVCLQFA